MTAFQRTATAAAIAALALCAAIAQAAETVQVKLSGDEEVPPVSASGSGSGSFTIGDDGAVSGSVTTTGVPGTMAHIHLAPKGKNGPVIVPLTKNGDTYTAPPGARLSAEQMKAFKAGDLYVNVHTEKNKGGEVRAQLNPSPY